MENVGRLEENLGVLLAEMSVLKHLSDDVARRRERPMERWLQNVDAIEDEVDELRKELKGIGKGSKHRLKLHKKVTESLRAVAELKREGNCNVLPHRVGAVAVSEGNDMLDGEDGGSSTVEGFLSQIENPLRYSSRQLREFTSDFSSALGHGAFGAVYKGEFPNGEQVAVKVLKNNGGQIVNKLFMAEVSTIGRTYHRNLVRLYGFCFDTDMKALVYEYVENGSLDKILYDNHLNIEWGKLYRIAIEIAEGLSYLHENCHKRIIHCDVKAGNVLIDTNLCPKIADFGLAKLCNSDLSFVTSNEVGGTPGYAAPELFESASVTNKCDVYSFGMLLFEVLQRKKNSDTTPGEDQKRFPQLVWEKFEKGQLDEIIRGCGIEEKQRENAKKLSMAALWCVQYEPEVRPLMSTVVKILEGEIPAMEPPYPFSHPNSSRVAPISGNMPSFFSSGLPSSEASATFVECDREAELQSPFQNEERRKEMHRVITVVLTVPMHCQGCAHDIKKCLMKIEGVETAAAYLDSHLVIVKGAVDPEKLVKHVDENTKKHANILIVTTE